MPVSINFRKIPVYKLEIKTSPKIKLHTNIELNLFNKLIIKFSDIRKISKTVCIFNRFLQFIQKPKQPPTYITAKEVQKAEQLCIKWAQPEVFLIEIKNLTLSKNEIIATKTEPF